MLEVESNVLKVPHFIWAFLRFNILLKFFQSEWPYFVDLFSNLNARESIDFRKQMHPVQIPAKFSSCRHLARPYVRFQMICIRILKILFSIYISAFD